MFGGINQKQVEKVMQKMGISQKTLDVKRVIFEMGEGEANLVIDEPSVTKIIMQGQETYQVAGQAHEEAAEVEKFSDEDVSMVVEKTGASEGKVREFLEENNGDIAMAIIELKK